MASSRLLLNEHAAKFVEFYLNRINRDLRLDLKLTSEYNGFEITRGNDVIWSGREYDVDLLGTIEIDWFEGNIPGRLGRLAR